MITRLMITLSLLAVFGTSCAPAGSTSPTPDLGLAYTQAVETAIAALLPSATPIPADTPLPPPTTVRTPPALPQTFVAGQLNPLDTPHTYLQDTCQYLQDKWNSNNAAPGTVVMVIMLHGIKKERADVTANDITVQDFKQ